MSQAADVRLASAILVMREKGFVEGKHGQLARPVLRMRTKVFLDGKPGRLVWPFREIVFFYPDVEKLILQFM